MDSDSEIEEMNLENASDDGEWTTESDSSNDEGIIEAGEDEEVRERYEREHGRLQASDTSESDAEEGAARLVRLLYQSASGFDLGFPRQRDMDDIVNPTISTTKATELRNRFKSRAPKGFGPKEALWNKTNRGCLIRSHRDRQNGKSKKVLENHCLSIIPSVCKTRPICNRYRVFSGTWTPNGKFFVTSSQKESNQIEIYDANHLTNEQSDMNPSRAIIKKINIEDVGWAIIDLAISSDSKYGAVTSWCNNISVFRIDNDRTDKTVHNIPLPMNSHSHHHGHRSAVFSLRYNHDSSKMFGGSNSGRLLLIDTATQKVMKDIDEKNQDDVNAVCFQKFSGNMAFAGGDSGVVSCWDMPLWQ